MLKNFFSKILLNKQKPTQLGRWNLDYCDKKIDLKVKRSNNDHCGSCGLELIPETFILREKQHKQITPKQNKK
jgi:hypothetical protein